MVEQSKLPVSIEIEKRVKEASDWLLAMAKEVQPHLNEILSTDKHGLGKSQIQHLMRAAKRTAGVGELKLFLEYQMGRDTSGTGWAKMWSDQRDLSDKRKKFGQRINDVLDQIDGESEKLSEGWDRDFKAELSRTMVERFFIYLHWHFTYFVSTLDNKKPQRQHNAGGSRS